MKPIVRPPRRTFQAAEAFGVTGGSRGHCLTNACLENHIHMLTRSPQVSVLPNLCALVANVVRSNGGGGGASDSNERCKWWWY